jgi:CheY-like chemotaxis protein
MLAKLEDPNKIHILFVDDDQDDREFIIDSFERLEWNQHIKALHDSETLMHYLKTIHNEKALPSLIVLDSQLPRTGGEAILATLKKDERLKNIPVIVITSSLNAILKERLAQIGAYSSHQKPYTAKEYDLLMRQLIQFVTDEQKAQSEQTSTL